MVPAMTQVSQLLRTAGAGWALAVPLFRARILALAGWRRRGLAFAAGGASVLAMAPFFAFPVLWLTLPVLVWLIEAQPAEEIETAASGRWARLRVHRAFGAAEAGWWFGFGYFFAGLIWIGEAFFVGPKVFMVLIPFAIAGLPALLAVFWAAATALARWPASLPTPSRVVLLAVTLGLAEFLRGHVMTGFPWNVLGYALTSPLPLMQSAAYVGIYGLTVLAVLIFALPLVLWAQAGPREAGRGMRATALAVALAPLAVMFVLGAWRLSGPPLAALPDAKVRIVQPSVPQDEKWKLENQERFFNDHLALSATNPAGVRDDLAGITHVVWPEAAMPFLSLEYPMVRQSIGRMLPGSTLLLAGGLRAEYEGEGPQRRRVRIFNSILTFGKGGDLVTQYDKIHLVPGGEYMPLQTMFDAIGLAPITRRIGGFTAGAGPRQVMHVPGLPAIGPLVCYEAIFPAAVVQAAERPGLLVNVTNDGWFGDSTGPRQHYHQARVRAVEEGLPLVRSANNGISAAFDAHGRVLGTLGMNVRGTLDVAVPQALPAPPYARYGDWPFLLEIAALLGWLAWRRR